MTNSASYKPALLVVDMQEDFCPPKGSLAVPDGRSIAPTINALLSLPFALKIGTRDWHPPDHISFASNHKSSDFGSASPPQPFTSSTAIIHPSDASRSYTTTLWPVHCVQNTAGAQLIPELEAHRLHNVLDKGQNSRLEMYSAFYDPFKICDSGLLARLKTEGITDVFVVGLAADYCVKSTAEHALDEGFHTFVVDEATKPVNPEAWSGVRASLVAKGVSMVSVHGEEVAKVKALQ